MSSADTTVNQSRRALYLWLLAMTIWTFALLTTMMVEAGDAVLPSGFTFYLGKVLHVLAYASLTFLTSRLNVSLGQRWIFLSFVSIHAFGTEYLQQFVGRWSSWQDVGLNHVGIVLGFLVSWSRWTSSPSAEQ